MFIIVSQLTGVFLSMLYPGTFQELHTRSSLSAMHNISAQSLNAEKLVVKFATVETQVNTDTLRANSIMTDSMIISDSIKVQQVRMFCFHL
jgi:hypothetical protein